MRFLSRALLLVAVGSALTAFFPVPAQAAETDSSELIIITEGSVVADDLYAIANRVIIRGVVEGDLIAAAASDITIEGEVHGSVTAIAPEVVVTGSIGGSLRASAPKVVVSGSVGRDVFAAAGTLELAEGGLIAGDAVVWVWDARLAGLIGGDLEGSQQNLELEGEVTGDVGIAASTLSVTGPLHVGGDLSYRSADDASGLDNANVEGVIVRQEPVASNIRIRALGLAGRILVGLVLSAVALMVVWAWPERSGRAVNIVGARPIRCYLSGAVVMFSPLILLAVGALIYWLGPTSTAVPLLVVLGPLVLASAALVLILGLVAGIPVVGRLGSMMRGEITLAGATGLGALVVSILWLVPVVGLLMPVLILPAGLGAWLAVFLPAPEGESVEAESAH